MLNLTVALWLCVVVYNFSGGLTSPSVDNGGPGDIQHNERSFYNGRRRPPYSGYIVNGQRAKAGQFPYQVRITNTKDTNKGFGGAITTPKHVITAARMIHALNGGSRCSPDNLVVQAGMIDLKELDDIEVFHVQQTICHSKYNSSTEVNNIAVIKIQETFIFTPYVKAVKISWRLPVPDSPVTISGWSEGSSVLTFVETYSIPTSECRRLFTAVHIPMMYFHPSVGCVHSYQAGGPYASYYDLGGAVVHDGKLIGVLSVWASSIATNTFTKVAYFRKWIEDIVGKQPDVSYKTHAAGPRKSYNRRRP